MMILLRIILILFCILMFFVGIAILVRVFPSFFSRRNIDAMRHSGSHGRVLVNSAGSAGRAALVVAAVEVVSMVGKVGAMFAETEQKKILSRKINETERTIDEMKGKFPICFQNAFLQMADKLDFWKKQIAASEFDYPSFCYEVEEVKSKLFAVLPLCQEIAGLFEENTKLISELKNKNLDAPTSQALTQLEQAVKDYQDLNMSLEDRTALISVKDGLVQIKTYLEQFLNFENQSSSSKATPAGKTYYDVLEIVSSATPEEIKKAYREAAKKWHPDTKKAQVEKIEDDELKARIEKEYDDKFKEINEAYGILSDPQKRQEYDKKIRLN